MDPSIWSQLPDSLLDRILAFLPLRTLVSLRPTCKRFKSLLNTPSFLSLLTSSNLSPLSSSSFLIFSHPHFSPLALPLYDSSARLWRTISCPSSHLLSSSSGLLLFASGDCSLMVLNPLTNCSTIVPCPTTPVISATLVSTPASSPHGYKIFVPSSNSNWVFVYDSGCQLWSRFSGLPTMMGHSNPRQTGTPFRGSLLFTTPEPFSVVSFDLGTGSWDRWTGPQLPEVLGFVWLVSAVVGQDEMLFLVDGVGRDEDWRSIVVWKLAGEGWEEVWTLDEDLLRAIVPFSFRNYLDVYCFGHEGLVCVFCTTSPVGLCFDVGGRSCRWSPGYEGVLGRRGCGFQWFSFVPDLYALV